MEAIQWQRAAEIRGAETGSTTRPTFGSDVLLLSVSGTDVTIDGVPGVIPADVHLLPRWVRAVIDGSPLVDPDGRAMELDGAEVTGWICVQEIRHDGWYWVLDLETRWPRYDGQPELLMPRVEEPEEMSPERRGMAWAMG